MIVSERRCTARFTNSPAGQNSGPGPRCTKSRGHFPASPHFAYVPVSEVANEPATWQAPCPCCKKANTKSE